MSVTTCEFRDPRNWFDPGTQGIVIPFSAGSTAVALGDSTLKNLTVKADGASLSGKVEVLLGGEPCAVSVNFAPATPLHASTDGTTQCQGGETLSVRLSRTSPSGTIRNVTISFDLDDGASVGAGNQIVM